jgi:hypothetical protein
VGGQVRIVDRSGKIVRSSHIKASVGKTGRWRTLSA